ncbi:MAG: FadR/GntR family transcriptional regulator [Pseudomonadota bacterium]
MAIGLKSAREQPPDLAARLRAFIREGGYLHNQRLPPERELCEALGVSRGRLRTALQVLEDDGLVWRHVGRGTFVGARPVLNLDDVEMLRELQSPVQLLESRIAIEPALAGLAATHGQPGDIEQIRLCAARCRAAEDWRTYEACDSNLHDAIAQATRNKVLIYLFETLNTVRRSILWEQKRTTRGPRPNHVSYTEHDAIIAAITAHDAPAARGAMERHLVSVRRRILPVMLKDLDAAADRPGG